MSTVIELTPPTEVIEGESKPSGGAIIELTPPTAAAPEEEDGGILGSLERIGKQAVGTAQVIGTIGSGAVAEAVSGIPGVARSLTAGSEEGEKTIEGIQKAITLEPATEEGRNQLQAVGQFMQFITKAGRESDFPAIKNFFRIFSGDVGVEVLKKTGSPALAALANTLPTAGMAILGGKGSGTIAKSRQFAKSGKKNIEVSDKQVRKIIEDHSPEPQLLMDSSKAVFKEVDDLGASVKPKAFNVLVNDIKRDLKVRGHRPRIQKDVGSFVDEITEAGGSRLNLSDVDELREVAQGFAKSADSKTKSLGISIIDNIDDFLTREGVVDIPKGLESNVGLRLKEARNFYSRGKKGKVIQEIYQAARDADTFKFADTLKSEFKKLLKPNNKQGKFFSKEDKAIIRNITKGGKMQGLFDIVGKGGLQTNPIFKLGFEGSAAAIPWIGIEGAAILPIVGTISKALADRLRKKSASFGDAVIRSGRDPEKLIKAYLENTKPGKRLDTEVAELLLRPDIDLSLVKKPSPFVQSAIQKAIEARAAMAGAAATGGAIASQTPNQDRE